jgi:hypothetical protein
MLSQDGTTPLFDACQRGDTPVVQALVSARGIDANGARSVSRLMVSLFVPCAASLTARCVVDNEPQWCESVMFSDGGMIPSLSLVERSNTSAGGCPRQSRQDCGSVVGSGRECERGSTGQLDAQHSFVASGLLFMVVCACVCMRVVGVQDGTTPLYDACIRGDSAIVKVLVAAPGVNLNIAKTVR